MSYSKDIQRGRGLSIYGGLLSRTSPLAPFDEVLITEDMVGFSDAWLPLFNFEDGPILGLIVSLLMREEGMRYDVHQALAYPLIVPAHFESDASINIGQTCL